VTGDQIREGFLDFFRQRGHTVVPSAPLVPENDPSLLFTNAGMVPFKQVFLGKETRPYRRAANSQKCLRISGKHNDLEQVGRDTYHHTFFEMLGNWSFGDYYKREAIEWAWELLTKVWKLPKDKLYATVYTTDDEAAALWAGRTDVGRDRILRFEAENFWEMGETGPCGPCSEIHIDRGPAACDRRADETHRCAVNGGCARYIELWNLVFIQHNRDAEGKLSDLPARHVDTGMGFERICTVLQGVGDNYAIDVLRTVVEAGERLSGKRYGATERDDVSLRVIADHGRAVTFLVADHILPSNEGRGYVLRRLLRRAARHGKLLGLERPFLHEVVGAVVQAMGRAYPEVAQQHRRIAEVVKGEEERFSATLDRGLALLSSEVEKARAAKARVLSGEVAFRLYDTYGFPLDLTEDIVAGEGLAVDKDGFERAMEAQRARGRGAQRFADAEAAPEMIAGGALASRFVGDRIVEWESEVLALLADGQATRAPRMLGFQASGAAPIVTGRPVPAPSTIATAIRIGNPASWRLAETARDESGGLIGSVTDEQILAAYRLLASKEAVFGELASAAGVAGLLQAREAGQVPAGSLVVCTISGNGLKEPGPAIAAAPEPVTIPADAAAAAAALGLR